VAVAALGLAGCSLLARDHACWPYLAERFHGNVPPDLVKQLARERRSRRRVGAHTAPIGSYWRPARVVTPEEFAAGTPRRAAERGWEILPCPGFARAERAAHPPTAGARESTVVLRPGGPALPLRTRSRTLEE